MNLTPAELIAAIESRIGRCEVTSERVGGAA